MPTLTIDGREVTVPDGTNLVEAAKQLGIEIPTFCYHKNLSIAANCRMCLVKGEQGGRSWPKPMPACQMIAADGMVIDASSDEVKKLRRAVLEFILINHPLDCPICDKAGECSLQDTFFKHSNQPSRFREPKEEHPKKVDLGPRIVYDGERCILCTRCVRFMDEVAKDPQLGTIHRGDHSYIATASDQAFDHPYSVNTVDICPVGALTDKAFRFKQRAWFLAATPSVCTGCARGCNTFVDASTIDQRGYRIRPRDNDAVNGPWMCDDGRLTFRAIHEGRLTVARVNGSEQADLQQATTAAIEALKPFFGAEELALACAATVSVEDAFAVAKLAREVLDTSHATVIGRTDWEGDAFLQLADHNPNRRGVGAVLEGLGFNLRPAEAMLTAMEKGEIRALVLVGGPWPHGDLDRVGAAIAKLDASVALCCHDDAIARAASVALPLCTFAEAEGTMVNGLGRVQHLAAAVPPAGMSRPAWAHAVALALTADATLAFKDLEQLRAQVAEQVAAFAGLALAEVPAEGVALDGDTRAPRFMGDKGDA